MSLIEEIIFGFFNKQALIYAIPIGYLIFFLYFYGSEKWKEFTDFDKISFSIITSFVISYFIAHPISLFTRIIHNIFIFKDETNIISPDQNQLLQTYIDYLIIIVGILFIIKLFSKCSLYENERIYNILVYIIFSCTLFLTASIFFFLMSFYVSGYSDYFKYLFPSIFITIVFLTLFLLIYMSVHRKFENPLTKINNYMEDKLNSENHHYNYLMGVILIVFIIFSISIGFIAFKPIIIENGQQLEEINIDYLPVSEPSRNVNAEKLIEKYYTIETKRIPWVKIDTNLTLKNARGEVDGHYTKYEIDGSNFTAIDCSKKTNITVSGFEDYYITNEDFSFEVNRPAFENNTEIIYLTLKNNAPVTIKINDIALSVKDNYNLSEDDFVKTRLFANNKGSIGWYEQKNNRLYLQNIHLYKNATGTITLILNKIES